MLIREPLKSIHQPAKEIIRIAGSEERAEVGGKKRNGGLWIGPPLHRLLKNASLALRPGSPPYLSLSLARLREGGHAAFIRGGSGTTGSPGREYASGSGAPPQELFFFPSCV